MSTPPLEELVAFLREQLAKAEQAVRSREQAVEAWSTGTDAIWREVAKMNGGKFTPKKVRMETAAREARILIKCRREAAMFREAVRRLEGAKPITPEVVAHPITTFPTIAGNY